MDAGAINQSPAFSAHFENTMKEQSLEDGNAVNADSYAISANAANFVTPSATISDMGALVTNKV